MIFGLYIEFDVNLFLYLFFIVFCLQFNCCVVNFVMGVNNDFDEMLWCIIEGKCYDVNVQILKICCVGEKEVQLLCDVYVISGFKMMVEFYLCVIIIC